MTKTIVSPRLHQIGLAACGLTLSVAGAGWGSQISRSSRTYPPSFQNDVQPVLTKMSCNSGACHGATAGKGGLKLSLRGYDSETDHLVLTRQAGGRRVSQVEPELSLILRKPTATIPHGGGRRFAPDSPEYRILRAWIAAGAPGPKATDPMMTGLEVVPRQATMSRGDRRQIRVRARFSDGKIQDVTRWAKFGTSDSGIAQVADDGMVSVQAPGEAAITIWYLSQVTFARISSPFPSQNAAKSMSANRISQVSNMGTKLTGSGFSGTKKEGVAASSSFIDVFVDRKLRALNIPASGDATDAEFIRRAYLDAAGILPTAAEVERFLTGQQFPPTAKATQGAGVTTRRMRRAKVIDSLLERPEFVDFWTYKWSDLLLVSSRELPSRSMRAFSNWIRQSVAENKPWDRFAREIITASGSTLENGAANYYVLHRDPVDVTETTTQAFLGMSLTCARCHNHPLEKWTQNQYYEMANLVSRVARKNGDSGDVVVYTASTGEIRHPRTGRALAPRPLDGRPLDSSTMVDRRQYLADWLTSPENPYFARAIVNRVWRQFMGRGLVEAEDDLRLTNPPTNEELMTALTADFVRNRFDVKRLIRTIMNSRTYQRSSQAVPGNASDQKYYSHYIVRRLPAEVILDALTQVTEAPTEFAGYPKGSRAIQLPDSRVDSYFLTAFGRPDRITTCSCERQQEPSIAQALHLANGETINKKLQSTQGVIARMVDQTMPDEQVLRQLYLAALSRLPTAMERQKLVPVLAEAPPAGDDSAKASRRQVIEDMFWAILTGREFLFNH